MNKGGDCVKGTFRFQFVSVFQEPGTRLHYLFNPQSRQFIGRCQIEDWPTDKNVGPSSASGTKFLRKDICALAAILRQNMNFYFKRNSKIKEKCYIFKVY